MSEKELIDEAMTLIVAGHETTASGLNWTWYLLSQNPEAEARLHAEIDAAAGEGRARASRRWSSSRTRRTWSTRRCACIRRAGCCRAARSTPDTLGGLRSAGRHRRAALPLSTAPPSALLEGARRVPARALRRRRTKPSVRVSPTCPSRRAPGIASARRSPCMKCTCTYIRWRAATGCATCPTGRSSSKRRSTCAPNIPLMMKLERRT